MANKIQNQSKELFRYARIEQPRIIDLESRCKKIEAFKRLKSDSEKSSWAKIFLESNELIKGEADIAHYFELLKIKKLPKNYLPTKEVIKDIGSFQESFSKNFSTYSKDYENCLLSIMAYKIQKQNDKAIEVSKILCFLEIYPRLDKINERIRYAYPVLNKISIPKIKTTPLPKSNRSDSAEEKRADEVKKMAENISILWKIKNKMLKAHNIEYDKKYNNILYQSYIDKAEVSPSKGRKGKTNKKVIKKLRQNDYTIFSKDKIVELSYLKRESESVKNSLTLNNFFDKDSKELVQFFPGHTTDEIDKMQRETKVKMKDYGINADKFCEAYEQAVSIADKSGVIVGSANQPRIPSECFKENPQMHFDDNLRILGNARLIKVEETFMGYEFGEVSYIETILAGETKKKEVRSTKYFEQVSESITEDTSQTTEEKDTSTKLDLSSEIKNEINTRFNSDINSSASGSAGGKFEVIDFKGDANVNAQVGVGIDTAMSTSNSSNLSQEIVNKAVENTKKTSIEKRMSRTYSMFETTDMHEINNANRNSLNGVYCFLDKRVCISETIYGTRLFLLANISLPGKNLLCERMMKINLANFDLGAKPIFNITPDQITRDKYKDYVGQYKAYNVQPPPPPVMTLSRTYKTDTSNANVQQEEFNMGKMAKSLTPFFEKYKRFLISENIKLPDGYQVAEVCVTVNHGSSGVSIPAELPLKLLGSALGTSLTIFSALTAGPLGWALLIPLGAWQFEYSVSPLMYYNADSSNVTISLGNESQDSPYYFFPADFLIKELFDFLGSFADRIPNILLKVEDYLTTTLMPALVAKAEGAATSISEFTQNTVDQIITNLHGIFSLIKEILSLNIKDLDKKGKIRELEEKLKDWKILIDSSITKDLETKMGNLFEPFKAFVEEIITYINDELKSTISDFIKHISALTESSQTKCFFNCIGMRGELPLTLNTIAINPGVTVNLVACLTRTEEAMDKWRLETYNALYQSYLQQAAEYESKLFINGNTDRLTKSPGTMREEEMLAIKERVLHCLNNHRPPNASSAYIPPHNKYDFMNMNLFENAIDWNNISYKLYNYGPNQTAIAMEKSGFFEGVDKKRISFLKALWAQVLIPIQDNEMLESGICRYLTDADYDVSESGINKGYLFEYLFSWEEIPGDDNDRLIGFLRKRFDIEWADHAEIKKSDDNKTIRLSFENNFLSLNLNDDRTKVILEIDNVRTDEFITKTENGKLFIYNKDDEADDMTALYQDLILGRELSMVDPETKIIRQALIPTDLICVQDGLPPRKDIQCSRDK